MKIGVMGAGSIGCYVGGRLQAAGVPVCLVGRPALFAEIATHGLRLTDFANYNTRLAAERVTAATSPEALADCDVVLVTVKGGDTPAAAAGLAPVLAPKAYVVSFQNGVGNPELLRAGLAGRTVLAGMVPFNVVRKDGCHFHQGTSGTLAVEESGSGIEGALVAALTQAGLPARAHPNMTGVLWGKLLLNLNNSVNALAGVPLKEELAHRAYRRVVAACMREGLRALKAQGIAPIVDVPLPAPLLPTLLSLPDVLFRVVAARMVRIDPQARSSMWEDLERGRKTEVDALNGEIVRLCARAGLPAPVNTAIVALVKEAEARGSPRLSAGALYARVCG